MNQKYLMLGAVILLVIIGGYLGRHQIKSMLGMSAPTPVAVAPTESPTSNPTVAAAPSDNIYLTKTDSTKGQYLTDFAGMTLYTYDKDATGVSNCSGACAQKWKPYTSGATAESTLPTNITVIKRADGSSQFAWKGMPLYYYSADQNVGDLMGDGFGGVWHLVKPS